MTKRTDIHRPSAISTADYEFVSFDYYGPNAGNSFEAEKRRFDAHFKKTGGKYSGHEHGGTCHVCGATALYVAKFYHAKTNTYICTGEDCAEKIFGRNDLDFASWRKRVANNKEAATGRAKAQKFLADNGLSEAWEIYITLDISKFKYEENTIVDIVHKLVRYGSISPKQVEFVAKLLAQIPAREEVAKARAAADAGSVYLGTVGEKIEFEGTVSFITGFDSQFGYVTVTGIREINGNIIIHKGSKPAWDKGDKVWVKATVKAHNDRNGVKQTIITRPKLIDKIEAAA